MNPNRKTRLKILARRSAKFLAVLFWTTVFGFIAGERAANIIKEQRSTRFPCSYGTLIQAELIRDPEVKSYAYYQPVVRYSYEVNGRKIIGVQYHFGHTRPLSSDESVKFRRTFLTGAKVKVFYNPGNPYEAALVAGIDDADIAVFGLFLPFNAASVLFWSIMIRWLWRRISKSPGGGVPIKRHGLKIIICLPELTPAGLAGWTLMAGSFVGLVMYLYLPALYPVIENGVSCLLWPMMVLIAMTFAAYVWQALRQNSGREDLVIESQTLALPVNFGRTTRKTMACSQVVSLAVRPREHFYHEFSVTSYEVVLEHLLSDGKIEDEKLAEWYDRDKASDFVRWLLKTANLPGIEEIEEPESFPR
jgi:hypothetical protein